MKKTNTCKALAAMVLLGAAMMTGCSKKASFTYSEAEAAKQDIVNSVTATGTIEPVTSVDVGTQVSGVISKLYVDYNSVVKAGQAAHRQASRAHRANLTIRRQTTNAIRHSMTRDSSAPMTLSRHVFHTYRHSREPGSRRRV